MNRIKILEVNNIDLPGRRFNGYNMLEELSNKDFDIKQAVIIKQSDNDNVVKILNSDQLLSAGSKPCLQPTPQLTATPDP